MIWTYNEDRVYEDHLFLVIYLWSYLYLSGNQLGSGFLDELQEHESILNQCIGQLESAEATRLSLVLQLKEALQDQV